MASRAAMCDCGREHMTSALSDAAPCPECQRIEDEQYRNDPLIALVDDHPWRWSKAAMRQRLDVGGDVDE